MSRLKCESCAMPISNGRYCEHCTDKEGNLQSFDERVKRMSLFMNKQNPEKSDKQILSEVKEYLKKMPAWKNHPQLV